jgi:hypothetical protein
MPAKITAYLEKSPNNFSRANLPRKKIKKLNIRYTHILAEENKI